MDDYVLERDFIGEETSESCNEYSNESATFCQEIEDLKLKLKQSEDKLREVESVQAEKYQKLFKEHEILKSKLKQTEIELQESFSIKSENLQTNSTTNRLEKISQENLKLKSELDKIKTDQRAEAYKLKRQENAYNENIMLKKELNKLKNELKESKAEVEKMVKEKRQFKVDATRATEQSMKLKGDSQQIEKLKKEKSRLEKDLERFKEERAKEKVQADEMSKEIDRLQIILEDERDRNSIRMEKEALEQSVKVDTGKLEREKQEMQDEIKSLQSKVSALNQEIAFGKEDARKLKTQLSAHREDFTNQEKRGKSNEDLKNEIERLQGELKATYIESKRKEDRLSRDISQLRKENETLSDQILAQKSDVSQTERFRNDMSKMAKDSETMIGEIVNLKSVIADLRAQNGNGGNRDEELQSGEAISEPNSPKLMKEFLRQMSTDQ